MRKQIGMIKNKIAITPEAIKIIILFSSRREKKKMQNAKQEATEQIVCENWKRIVRRVTHTHISPEEI